MFQFLNNCEYVFVWRTVEACPVVREEGKPQAATPEELYTSSVTHVLTHHVSHGEPCTGWWLPVGWEVTPYP